MKAIVYDEYGPPEVLHLKEVAKPVPRDNEVLIKVYATTVHVGDTRMRVPSLGFPSRNIPWLMELVMSLGADRVIDYTKEDFTEGGGAYDIIVDAVGKNSLSECKKILAPNGVFTTPLKENSTPKTEDLVFLKGLIEAGTIRVVIDRTYPLD